MSKSPIKKLKELRESLEYFSNLVDTHKDIFTNLAHQIENLEEDFDLTDVPENDVRFTIVMESGDNSEVSQVTFGKEFWSEHNVDERLDFISNHLWNDSRMPWINVTDKSWEPVE